MRIFITVFLPREVFFIFAAVVASYIRLTHRNFASRTLEADAIRLFSQGMDEMHDEMKVIERALEQIVGVTKAKAGLIKLYNNSANNSVEYQMDEFKQDKLDFLNKSYEPDRPFEIKPLTPPRRNEELILFPVIVQSRCIGVIVLLVSPVKNNTYGIASFVFALAEQVGCTIERLRFQNALSDISRIATSAFILDGKLDMMIHDIVDTLGLDYACIGLIDEYMDRISMVRGRNVPPRQVHMAHYKLDHPDIMADIARTGKTEKFLAGEMDPRFNIEIYKMFEHEQYARFFVPLVSVSGQIIGTIEAGCSRAHQNLMTIVTEKRLEEIGRKYGDVIGQYRTHILLSAIAQRAIEIVGADSASIHVYKGDTMEFQAGAGMADKEFLLKFPPRKNGIGWKSIQEKKEQLVDKVELHSKHAELFAKGVRTIAAFPLIDLGESDMKGVLYLHFWNEKIFSNRVMDIAKLFAKQLEIVIQNYLLLKYATESKEQAWNVSLFQNFIQSLANAEDASVLLDKIANNALSYLRDVECVVLYKYFQKEQRFDVPPVMKGCFVFPDEMHTEIHEDDILWSILKLGESRFIVDVTDNIDLRSPRKSEDRNRFIDREKIKSSAHIVLRSHKGEIVGILFINYRKRHEFSLEEQKAIKAIGSAAAIAIESARLIYKERAEEELGASYTLKKTASKILDELGLIIDFKKASLQLFQEDSRVLIEGRGFNIENANPEFMRPLSKDPFIRSIRDSKSIRVIPDTRKAQNEPFWENREATFDVQSWIGVPLIFNGHVFGMLTIDHDEPGKYINVNINNLIQFANQASVSLNEAMAYDEVQKRIESLLLMEDVSQLVCSTEKQKELLDSITQKVVHKMNCDQCTIYRRGQINGETVLKIESSNGQFNNFISERIDSPFSVSQNDSPVKLAFNTGTSYAYANATNTFFPSGKESYSRRSPRSIIAAPIIAGGHVLGVIATEKNCEGYFKESHKNIISAIGRSTGVIIERDIGFHLLSKVGTEILKADKIDDVMKIIVDGATMLTEIDAAAIYLFSADGKILNEKEYFSTGIVQTLPNIDQNIKIINAVLEASKAIYIDNSKKHHLIEWAEQKQFTSICAIPFIIGKEVVGILFMYSQKKRLYNKTETLILESLADQAALVLMKIRLLGTVEGKLHRVINKNTALQKLKGINEHTGAFFHKVMNPINAINSAVECIKNSILNVSQECFTQGNGSLPPVACTRKAKLDALYEQLVILKKTAEDLCDSAEQSKDAANKFSRNAGTVTTFSIKELLDDIDVEVRKTLKDKNALLRVSLQINNNANERDFSSYRGIIAEAISSVVVNAIESIPIKGNVIITLHDLTQSNVDYLRIKIQDDGIGISPQDLQNIWEIRYSTKTGGSGFGLWFAKHQFEVAEIICSVKSDVGQGTEFELLVPFELEGALYETNNV